MKWVAAAIVVYIVAYTFINLEFRKPEPAHEPWAEAQARRDSYVVSVREDWTRFRTTLAPLAGGDAPGAARGETPPAAAITTRGTPARLETIVPLELTMVVPARPILYPSPDRIDAPAAIGAEDALALRLHFENGQAERPFGELMAWAGKDHHLYLFLQDVERLPEGFQPTPPAEHLEVKLPAGGLEAGAWKATLYAAEKTFDWTFEVR